MAVHVHSLKGCNEKAELQASKTRAAKEVGVKRAHSRNSSNRAGIQVCAVQSVALALSARERKSKVENQFTFIVL